MVCRSTAGVSGARFAALLCGALLWNVGAFCPAADETPLVKHMNAINDAHKTLRTQARTAAFTDESVKLVVEMQTHALAAMHETPPMVSKAPAAKQKGLIAGYRKSMAKLVNDLMALEVAMLDGKKEEAKAGVDKLLALKKEGHDAYVEE